MAHRSRPLRSEMAGSSRGSLRRHPWATPRPVWAWGAFSSSKRSAGWPSSERASQGWLGGHF
eukprot:13629721-Alexandrium_andersonii.AAC.1